MWQPVNKSESKSARLSSFEQDQMIIQSGIQARETCQPSYLAHTYISKQFFADSRTFLACDKGSSQLITDFKSVSVRVPLVSYINKCITFKYRTLK